MTVQVARTCTEIPEDERQHRRIKDSRALASFRSVLAYVLLGDPGSGKTTSFETERDALGAEACLVTARDFLALETDAHPEWHGKTLFIDGLDEVRAGGGDARTPFDAVRGRLEALRRPRFRLSCREADWLGTNDRINLAKVSPDADLTVLRLDPLADDGVEGILNAHSDIEDVRSFVMQGPGAGSRRISRESSEPDYAGRRRDERPGLAGEPSAALRSGLPAGAVRAERGAQGRREGIGSRDDIGRRSSGCRRKAVRSASRLRSRRLCNRARSGRPRPPGSRPVRASVSGTVSPSRFHEAVQGRSRRAMPAGSSARRRIPGRQILGKAYRWPGTKRSGRPAWHPATACDCSDDRLRRWGRDGAQRALRLDCSMLPECPDGTCRAGCHRRDAVRRREYVLGGRESRAPEIARCGKRQIGGTSPGGGIEPHKVDLGRRNSRGA